MNAIAALVITFVMSVTSYVEDSWGGLPKNSQNLPEVCECPCPTYPSIGSSRFSWQARIGAGRGGLIGTMTGKTGKLLTARLGLRGITVSNEH